ncbi:MAG: competence/damage-inducible protein A [Bacteroidales bacterium]|nr:competence/damage-inducible protein A [Bacteroidales bacterium]MCF8402506.1 competence/damage-inducible protein A [Bacteroidales bacterium]
MLAEIISIGDELLVGQVVNTNASWMAQALNNAGIRVCQISSISDEQNHIFKALDEASQRAQLILITGGLGPTNDDITKHTLTQYFKTELVYKPEVFDSITELFKKFGRNTSRLSKEQAMVPASCIPIINNHGTAPGMWFEKEGKVFISMPGVPYEMKGMMLDYIIPKLKKEFHTQSVLHKTILTQGIPESILAQILKDWEDALPKGVKLAYLPKPGMVRLRLSVYGENNEQSQRLIANELSRVKELLADDIFGYDKDTLEQVVGQLLKAKGWSVSTAESCTGGSIAQMITSVAGSSDYYRGSIVAYANDVKQHILGVKEQSLIEFGAVSESVSQQMAEGARKVLKTDCAIATTGIAGPGGGTPEKPVGTTWIAVSTPIKTFAKKYQMGDQRERNIQRAALTALNMLRKELIS